MLQNKCFMGGKQMAKTKSSRGSLYYRKRRRRSALPLWISLLLVVAVFCVMLVLDLSGLVDVFGNDPREVYTVSGGTVEIHTIDVGQADCILVMAPEGNILFDSGENEKALEADLKEYLDSLGITEIKYFIITHPDSDHIGGADMIINSYNVDTVLMEPYTYDKVTGVYTDAIEAIEANNVNVVDPSPGEKYSVGELHLTILGPIKDYGDKNKNSIVTRLDFGSTSALMTGDADKAESDLASTYSSSELDCDVLKVSHHGSRYGSIEAFLNAVTPEIALISCGEGNSHGHPTDEALDRLTACGAEILRTDLLGDIVIIMDGTEVRLKGDTSSGGQ